MLPPPRLYKVMKLLDMATEEELIPAPDSRFRANVVPQVQVVGEGIEIIKQHLLS